MQTLGGNLFLKKIIVCLFMLDRKDWQINYQRFANKLSVGRTSKVAVDATHSEPTQYGIKEKNREQDNARQNGNWSRAIKAPYLDKHAITRKHHPYSCCLLLNFRRSLSGIPYAGDHLVADWKSLKVIWPEMA